MDRVRFGRALGGGAREAAKALLRAADAAAAPNPTRPAATPSPAQSVAAAAARPEPVVFRARSSAAGLRRGGKRFGEAIWGPLARQTGVLWLEFTGVFFGLFAVSAGVGVWQHRSQLLHAQPGQHRVWLAVAMSVLFGYFTVSSFARAARRGRR